MINALYLYLTVTPIFARPRATIANDRKERTRAKQNVRAENSERDEKGAHASSDWKKDPCRKSLGAPRNVRKIEKRGRAGDPWIRKKRWRSVFLKMRTCTIFNRPERHLYKLCIMMPQLACLCFFCPLLPFYRCFWPGVGTFRYTGSSCCHPWTVSRSLLLSLTVAIIENISKSTHMPVQIKYYLLECSNECL